MFSLALLLADIEGLQQRAAVREAIRDKIQYGVETTIAEDIDRYMEGVPQDLRILGGDGSVTDWGALKAKQLRNCLSRHVYVCMDESSQSSSFKVCPSTASI